MEKNCIPWHYFYTEKQIVGKQINKNMGSWFLDLLKRKVSLKQVVE